MRQPTKHTWIYDPRFRSLKTLWRRGKNRADAVSSETKKKSIEMNLQTGFGFCFHSKWTHGYKNTHKIDTFQSWIDSKALSRIYQNWTIHKNRWWMAISSISSPFNWLCCCVLKNKQNFTTTRSWCIYLNSFSVHSLCMSFHFIRIEFSLRFIHSLLTVAQLFNYYIRFICSYHVVLLRSLSRSFRFGFISASEEFDKLYSNFSSGWRNPCQFTDWCSRCSCRCCCVLCLFSLKLMNYHSGFSYH